MSIVARRDAERLEQRPTPDARGLPNRYFVEDGFFQNEQKQLFHRTWVFAGITDMVKEPGSLIQREVAGVPIVLIRSLEGELNAFQNVCPHRGARLIVEDKPSIKRMVCPYHAWTFDLGGKLVARPHFQGPGAHARDTADDDFHCEGLFPVRMETWNGAILVNIGGKAAPIDDYLAPLNEETFLYDLSQMRYATCISSEFSSNWKLTIENWLDSYHVFAVHPHLNKIMENAQRKAAIGRGSLIYADYFATATGEALYGGLPSLRDLPDELSNAAFFALQFPNWSISIHPTYLLFWHYVPLAVNSTRMDVYAYFVGDAADDDEHAEPRKQLLDYYNNLNDEDAGICKRLQEGRQATAYDGGRFSPYWDGGSAHLAKLVQEMME